MTGTSGSWKLISREAWGPCSSGLEVPYESLCHRAQAGDLVRARSFCGLRQCLLAWSWSVLSGKF